MCSESMLYKRVSVPDPCCYDRQCAKCHYPIH
jgi:hypothetical protein